MTIQEIVAKLKALAAEGKDAEIETLLGDLSKPAFDKVEAYLESSPEGKRLIQSISDRAVSAYEKEKLPQKQEEYFKKKQLETNPPEDPEKKLLLDRIMALETDNSQKARNERIMAHKSTLSKALTDKKLPAEALELIDHLGLDIESEKIGEKAGTIATILEKIVNVGADARISGNAHNPGNSAALPPPESELNDNEFFEKKTKK